MKRFSSTSSQGTFASEHVLVAFACSILPSLLITTAFCVGENGEATADIVLPIAFAFLSIRPNHDPVAMLLIVTPLPLVDALISKLLDADSLGLEKLEWKEKKGRKRYRCIYLGGILLHRSLRLAR